MANQTRRTTSGRPVAAAGWRRGLIGLVVGATAGALLLVARRT